MTSYLRYENKLPRGKKVTLESAQATHIRMTNDAKFMGKLDKDQIISPESADYVKWKSLKETFLEMNPGKHSIAERYGYKPAKGSFLTAFTCMFLHGSVSHLLGNMVFLWFVGCCLELGGLRMVSLIIYLVTGMFAAYSFGLLNKGSTIPLVGASGAISGLIGAYSVFFGRRKVPTFLTLGFYCKYTKVYGILLLPFWIGYQFFELEWGGQSNVAYMAHVGGLVSGAALAFGHLKLLGGIKQDVFAESRTEREASLVERALKKVDELDLRAARDLATEALELNPESRAALTCLFNIEKLDPARENLHAAAEKLLLSLYRDTGDHGVLFSLYKDYCQTAITPGSSPDMCAKLSQAFSEGGFLEDSIKLAGLLLLRTSKQYFNCITDRKKGSGGMPCNMTAIRGRITLESQVCTERRLNDKAAEMANFVEITIDAQPHLLMPLADPPGLSSGSWH